MCHYWFVISNCRQRILLQRFGSTWIVHWPMLGAQWIYTVFCWTQWKRRDHPCIKETYIINGLRRRWWQEYKTWERLLRQLRLQCKRREWHSGVDIYLHILEVLQLQKAWELYVHAMVVVDTTWLFKNLRKLLVDIRTVYSVFGSRGSSFGSAWSSASCATLIFRFRRSIFG